MSVHIPSDKELLARISSGEDSLTEFKPQGAGSSDFKKTLVAFANSVPDGYEALLFIGISNDGTIVGVDNPDNVQKMVRKICEEECYPPIAHASRVIDCGNKRILAVIVGFSLKRPHFTGVAYIRKGSASVKATPELYEDLINSRMDKCRKLLAYKGRLITVASSRVGGPFGIVGAPLKSLGVEILPFPVTGTQYEAIVLGCDAFSLLLQVKSSGRKFPLRLTQVELDYDVERGRLMIRYE
jgi:hypothetical protein